MLPLTQGSAGGQGRGPGVGDVDVLVAGGGPALPARGALCHLTCNALIDSYDAFNCGHCET